MSEELVPYKEAASVIAKILKFLSMTSSAIKHRRAMTDEEMRRFEIQISNAKREMIAKYIGSTTLLNLEQTRLAMAQIKNCREEEREFYIREIEVMVQLLNNNLRRMAEELDEINRRRFR